MVETWVLIMTLTFTETGSIATVSGFRDERECQVAGLVWRRNAHRGLVRQGRATFTCVGMNKKPLPAEAPLEERSSAPEVKS